MPNPTCDAIVIRAPRHINALTAPHLLLDLESRLKKHSKILLDLGQTQRIEPEQVEVILQCLMLVRQSRGQLGLRGVNPQVRMTLEISGVLDYFRRT